VRAGRAEALDLFRKWAAERALLRCDFSFARFAACLRGRVRAVTDSEIKLLSDDTASELALRLPEGLEFGYGEPRGFPEEAAFFRSALLVLFPGEGERDFISFTEIIGH